MLATYQGVTQKIARSVSFQRVRFTQSTSASSRLRDEIALVAAAKRDVETRLSRYTPAILMNKESASKAVRSMAAWANDFGPAVSSLPGDSAIPDSQRPSLPVDEARNFVASTFFDGVYGFHFYENGTIDAEIAAGRWTEQQALDDLDGRKRAFQLLTAMDEDGSLTRIYSNQPVSGLGAGPAAVLAAIPAGAWAVFAVAVAVAGAFLYKYIDNRNARDQHWDAIKSLCDKAISSGDKDTMSRCSDALKPPEQSYDPINLAVVGLVGVLGVYLFGYFVVPKLLARREAGLA